MMPQISLKTDGVFDPSRLQAWTRERQAHMRRAVTRAFREWGREISAAANETVRARMKVRKRQFPGFRAKVFADKPERMPALLIRSRIPWLGVHGRGGTVSGSGRGLLIPLLDKRIGPRAFKRVLDHILRTGAGFWKEVKGQLILFAEYQPEYGQPLAKFRRAERARRGGKSPKRWAGESIPIAVLVPSVKIEKRFDLEAIIRRGLPRLVRKIENYIGS